VNIILDEASMFQRLIDDFRDKTGAALQLTSLAAATGLAVLIAIIFLCAAGFVWVLRTYGLIEACVAGAGVFLVVAAILAGGYKLRKNQIEARAAARTKSAVQTALADPMVVAAGLQLMRSVGVKKLIPILALGGLALGLMASRNNVSDQAPAE
jgi:hypothetical protein